MPADYKKDLNGSPPDPIPGEMLEAFRPYIPLEERVALDDRQLERVVLNALSASPVPLAVLIGLAEKSGFSGYSLLVRVAAAADSPGFFDTELPGTPDGIRVKPKVKCDVEGKEKTSRRAGDREQKEIPPGTGYGAHLTVDTVFAGLFAVLGEKRDGQLEMANAVMSCFRSGGFAFIEAGTGTGKSLAYLVPAILHSLETGERIVVSTYTRNLQNQLMTREITRLVHLLDIEIPVARLMGRENYICSRKLVSMVIQMSVEDASSALALALSAALAPGGTVESISPAGKLDRPKRIGAPPRCSMNACSHSDRCPLLVARKKARESALVFVNHALIMTDYRQEGSVIGPYHRVVFDEAHHLEHSVMENLSVRIFGRDLVRIFDQVSPISTGNERWRLLISELEEPGGLVKWTGQIDALALSMVRLMQAFDSLFNAISDSLNPDKKLRSTKTRYHDGAEAFGDIRDEVGAYQLCNNEFRETLKLILDAKVSVAGHFFQQELKYVDEELATLLAGLEYLTSASDEESVFWIEWSSKGAASGICGSPLEIDRRFADYLEESCGSAVFTSATLAEEGSFTPVRKRLGTDFVNPETIELMVPSHFKYEENLLILLQTGLGDPNDPDYAGVVGDIVSKLAVKVRRRMMVLFTSYRMCQSVSRHLESIDLPGPVFMQGMAESREALASSFGESDSGILLGVASFWEGVDFPGEQLELLVIPKLPFPVPSEPIIEARSDKIRRLGENPFTSLHLPEAILRLRQGVGRLIRRSTDRGVVVILDSRLDTRPYAKNILSALPVNVTLLPNVHVIVSKAADWFNRRGTL